MKKSGAAIAVACLIEQGVDTVFGYPGVSVLKIYDELYKNRRSIRHILTSHEQGAAHAADGYARATRRTGVCIATSGPGATNLVTGIAAAFMDSSPVVFITCNVPESQLGRDAFQEVDITGIAMPITNTSVPEAIRMGLAKRLFSLPLNRPKPSIRGIVPRQKQ
ncbi:MAG: thiamine pyrophosphate-binding protein, partial [Oscillospiraceae bacterium]|nr:thiamine pyrophosphate-binding protein [Oscillospiraceae bacterium]